ncbi:MAG: tRNA threonylcarbamoyladenosine dehydratase [Kiritimatiellae bacterium]|nr:tRNA threonylcarbamoyladenosine dehydratase [Kiritimatiellia bacterium]
MNPFSRTELLLGSDSTNKLNHSHVAVFGLGGVGSFAAEALARAGIGRLLLVDGDTVCPTNINRQLIALHSTVGKPKAALMAARIRDINPQAEVETRQEFYLPQNAATFDLAVFDYVVDAIDTVSAKTELAFRAEAAGVPIISCMGAGNKLDPTRFEVADIYATSVCPLCKVMRRELQRRSVKALKVVYSREPPRACLAADAGQSHVPQRRSPGSVSFVPSVAGLIMAAEVVRGLCGNR